MHLRIDAPLLGCALMPKGKARLLDRQPALGSLQSHSMSNTIRPSFESIYMDLAHRLAQRSTCTRLKVGTVITSTDYRKVLAVGYNGNATGLANCCDREEPGNCGCLHSEENAVINCDAPRTTEKIVFVTHLPCVQCAKRLINLGNVRRIHYAQDYRLRQSLDLLRSVHIEISQLDHTPLTSTVA